MKKLFTIGLISSVILVGGCGIENVNDSSSDVESDVGEENPYQYYNEAVDFVVKSNDYLKANYEDTVLIQIKDDTTKRRVISDTQEYLKFLNDLKLSPVYKEDYIMHEEVSLAMYNMEKVAEYALLFLETMDYDNSDLYKSYYNDYKENVILINNISEQYYQ